MGLFKKTRQVYSLAGGLATGDHREEIAEAKRGRPDVSLAGYAADRGLEWLDHASPAGFAAVVPQYEALQHNVMRGALPGGEYGIAFHDVMTIGLRQTRGAIPAVDSTPIGDGNCMWIEGGRLPPETPDPWKTLSQHKAGFKAGFTVMAARVPEAAGPLPAFRVDRRTGFPPYNFPETSQLDDRGLGGWRLSTVKEADRRALDRFLAGPVRELLAAKPFLGSLHFVYWHGTLIARCLHYLDQPADLDELGGALSLAARELRAVGLAHATPQPFTDRLPAPAWLNAPGPDPQGVKVLGATVQRGGTVDLWSEPVYDPPLNFTGGEWQKLIRAAAARYHMALEDPLAYHLAFPQVRVPGTAFAVLCGQLPGTTIDGRLALHTEKDLLSFNDGRNAVLLPAPNGTPDNHEWEERVPDSDLRIGVRGGIVSIWNRRSIPGHDLGDLDRLVVDAMAIAKARNLV